MAWRVLAITTALMIAPVIPVRVLAAALALAVGGIATLAALEWMIRPGRH